jgi:hypothetical protein
MLRKSTIDPTTPEELALYDECVKTLKGTPLRLQDTILLDPRTGEDEYRLIPEPGTRSSKRPKC